MEQRVSFSNKELARYEAEVVKMTWKRDASVAKAEQLVLEVPSVSGVAKEVKKICECLSPLKTAARAKVS